MSEKIQMTVEQWHDFFRARQKCPDGESYFEYMKSIGYIKESALDIARGEYYNDKDNSDRTSYVYVKELEKEIERLKNEKV